MSKEISPLSVTFTVCISFIFIFVPILRCQDEIDTCSSVTCAHNESCVNSSGNSYCNCTVDFVGRFCDTSKTANCTNDTCKNGGTCYQFTNTDDNITKASSGFNCTCQPGYNGDLCEFEEDYCSSLPCKNGGTCFSNVTILNYTCACPTGFTGETCDEYINYCRNDSCQNGECIEINNQFFCNCSNNWSGANCSEDVDECSEYQPCQNNATCENTEGLYNCNCTGTGYTGDNCSEDVDECTLDTNPCQNSISCTNTDGSYLCNCTLGYEGNNCQTPNCSQVTCENGGNCTDNTTDWKCNCMEFYGGETCEIEGPCVAEPCNDSNTVTCKQNLTVTQYTYTCDCKAGWEGQNCSRDKNECNENNPCVNGTCINSEGSYVCNCSEGFEGKNCSVNIDDCSSSPCQHFGICTDEVNGFTCDCSNTGYKNKTCMVDVEECAENNPCLNQGICLNFDGGYNCTCTEKYQGKLCQEIVDPLYEPVATDDNIWIIVGPVVAGVLVIIIIVLLIFLKIARKKRATRGGYSPSRQEMSGSRVELGNVMKQPPEERLI